MSNIFQKGLYRLPPEHVIPIQWKEFLRFGFKYSNNSRVLYGTQIEHDDTVISVGLMLWGLRERPYQYTEGKLGDRDHYVL